MDQIAPVAPDLPGRAWVEQAWRDVVFLHWRVDASAVAPLLPVGVRPDTIAPDGSDDGTTTWVGLIAFVFQDTRFPPLRAMHRLGTFVELNVRVYTVDEAGRRGVVFLSLDAGRFPPAAAARAMLGLPYHWAEAEQRRDGASVAYAMRRHGSRLRSRLGVRIGAPVAEPTAVDSFLTARWGMHVRRFGVTRFWPNEHESWPLFSASLEFLHDDLLGAAGLPMALAELPPDSVLYSPGVTTTFAPGVR
jgi:uncharacterized protein YqjF (DUF2071 family)